MIDKALGKVAANPVQFAIALGVVVAVGYFLVKHVGTAAAQAVGGVVSGNNALTQGTAYENKGVVGTLGAATNSALGGVPQAIGEALGGWLYDVTHRDYDPSSGLQSAQKTVRDGQIATDQLWGPIGSVQLRSF